VDKRRKILLLGCSQAETGKFRDLLASYAIVECALDIPELVSLLKIESYDALFCDRCFGMGTWREALEAAQKCDPGLPVIVVDHAGEEAEWIDVLNAGGFDLLVPPFDERHLRSVLEHAIVSREAQRAHDCAV
jgi:DNA-binding NtrC family response regulator